ncbi:hypothetical protein FACS1894187_01100 [Synergistales bacterium]|nr:hypothetical protein FACS1894187_01100 [Synergistales bacterium]
MNDERDILVSGYADSPKDPPLSAFPFVPVNITLNPKNGIMTGIHTPVYNSLIGAGLERIFLGNSIYAGMDFYVKQIEASIHLSSIVVLIDALYDLHNNLVEILTRHWSIEKIKAVDPKTIKLPSPHYDYFCSFTRLSERLNSTSEDHITMFAKVNASNRTIEDCWISKFGAVPDDHLRLLFCGRSLDGDPSEVIGHIETYYRITANKAIANLFMNLIKNCNEFYATVS